MHGPLRWSHRLVWSFIVGSVWRFLRIHRIDGNINLGNWLYDNRRVVGRRNGWLRRHDRITSVRRPYRFVWLGIINARPARMRNHLWRARWSRNDWSRNDWSRVHSRIIDRIGALRLSYRRQW